MKEEAKIELMKKDLEAGKRLTTHSVFKKIGNVIVKGSKINLDI